MNIDVDIDTDADTGSASWSRNQGRQKGPALGVECSVCGQHLKILNNFILELVLYK